MILFKKNIFVKFEVLKVVEIGKVFKINVNYSLLNSKAEF